MRANYFGRGVALTRSLRTILVTAVPRHEETRESRLIIWGVSENSDSQLSRLQMSRQKRESPVLLNLEEAVTRAIATAISEYVPKEWFDTEQAAQYSGWSKEQLESWRTRGEGPKYSKFPRAIRYARVDLDAFMQAHSVAMGGGK